MADPTPTHDAPPEPSRPPTIVLPPGGAPEVALDRSTSVLVHMHVAAGRLGQPELRGDTHRVDHLYGPHGLKFPVMALLVRRSMGPVRHALSQRTVAGGLKIVHAPGDRVAVPPSVPTDAPTPSPTPSSSQPTTPSPTTATR